MVYDISNANVSPGAMDWGRETAIYSLAEKEGVFFLAKEMSAIAALFVPRTLSTLAFKYGTSQYVISARST
jgi:hypothetical protein